jgi:asparagine N-glycosylation enzyme membrane subunit Stt3
MSTSTISNKQKARNVLFILLGVLLLLLKHSYNGSGQEIVKSYFGNLSISFAVYFLISFSSDHWKQNKLITAIISLTIVELFEITNGFGIMTNVFDIIDLIANLIGVILALVCDKLLPVINSKEAKQKYEEH